MASQIDNLKPTQGNAQTSDVRTNFGFAKTEIEALQTSVSAVESDLSGRSVNVKDYGAAGNGSTDDTTAVQNAINAVGAGTLIFPTGTYKVGDLSITDKPGDGSVVGYFNIEGNGASLVPLSSNHKIIMAKCKHVNISNLDFIQHSLSLRGVWFTNFTNCKMRRVLMGDANHSGSWMSQAWNVFYNCFLQSVEVLSFASYCNAQVWDSCKFRGESNQGFQQTDTSAFKFNSPDTSRYKAPISAAAISGTVCTVTTSTAHGFSQGNTVKITGLTDSGTNNVGGDSITIASVPSTTSLTFSTTRSGTVTIAGSEPSDSAVVANTTYVSPGAGNAQNWVIRGGDVSGGAGAYDSGIYVISGSNTNSDIELAFDGVYFDFELPAASPRDDVKIRTINCHSANNVFFKDTLSNALKGSSDCYNAERGFKHNGSSQVNLIPNGDLRIRMNSYEGTGRPISSSNATITDAAGGLTGDYHLNINTSSTSQPTFFRAPLKSPGMITGTIILRSASGGSQNIQLAVAGLYTNTVPVSHTEWQVFTFTCESTEAAGDITLIVNGSGNAQYNVDVAYVSITMGEGNQLITNTPALDQIFHVETYDWGNVTGSEVRTFTVPGVSRGDLVQVGYRGDLHGGHISGDVKSTNTVDVKIEVSGTQAIDDERTIILVTKAPFTVI